MRLENRRRLSVPVPSTIASASMDVIRPIGRKIRRRIGTSATSPITCGAALPSPTRATASRTRPTWSPLGSKMEIPEIRARYTRLVPVTTQA